MKEYQCHIDMLAKELGCKVVQGPDMPGMMYVESGYVEGPIITNQIDYLINLHELGHFAWGHTQGRPPHGDKKFYFENGVLKSEAQAWEWALNRCMDKIQDASRKFMWDTCLGSYYFHGYVLAKGAKTYLGNGNRHHVRFTYDRPDEYFTHIVKRIQGNLNDFNIKYNG